MYHDDNLQYNATEKAEKFIFLNKRLFGLIPFICCPSDPTDRIQTKHCQPNDASLVEYFLFLSQIF